MDQQIIKFVTLNIQKGWSLGKRKKTLAQIKNCIGDLEATLVCLQEVVGISPELEKQSQFEFLADGIWSHYAYGKNAVYSSGHHGNAILSKLPFISYENYDISNHRLESRGILKGVINLPLDRLQNLHVMTVHLDLTAWGRKRQIKKLCTIIEQSVPPQAPLIVCGDFNDWQDKLSPYMFERLGMSEAYKETTGESARTFPTFLPLLKLDRVYYRNLNLLHVSRLDSPKWHQLSDHLGLCVDFSVP